MSWAGGVARHVTLLASFRAWVAPPRQRDFCRKVANIAKLMHPLLATLVIGSCSCETGNGKRETATCDFCDSESRAHTRSSQACRAGSGVADRAPESSPRDPPCE